MTEYRAQAIILKKVLADKNQEIEILKARNNQEKILLVLKQVFQVFQQFPTLESTKEHLSSVLLQILKPADLSMNLKDLFRELTFRYPNQQIIHVVQKMNILLGQKSADIVHLKKLHLLSIELLQRVQNEPVDARIYSMAHNLLNSKTLEEKMVIEKPIVTALPVVVQTRETGCQTDFKVSLIDQEQPITSHFPETLTGMRLKQMAEALQELASEKA